MNAEELLRQLLAEYEHHCQAWEASLAANIPGYQPGQTVEDIESEHIDFYDELCEIHAFDSEALLDRFMERVSALLAATEPSP